MIRFVYAVELTSVPSFVCRQLLPKLWEEVSRPRIPTAHAESAGAEYGTETLPAASVRSLTRVNFGYGCLGNAKRGGGSGVLQGGIHGHGGNGLLGMFLGGLPVGPGRRRSENDVIRPDFNRFECFWKFRKAEKALVQMERAYHSFVPKS